MSGVLGVQTLEVELVSVLHMPLNLLIPRRWQRRVARHVAKLDDFPYDGSRLCAETLESPS